jgi:hypothetical protein
MESRTSQVLESNVNILQGGLEEDKLLFHHTGLIGVEANPYTSRTAPEAGSRLPNHVLD